MAKLIIGKTPEQIQREEDERNKERIANIQEQEIEQQRQLRELVFKQKRNRWIVISIFSIFSIALLIFGTYNTFFKAPLNVDDVARVVYQYQSQLPDYSYSGLDGFIRNNFDKWYNDQLLLEQTKNNAFEYVKGNLDSITIDEIRHDSNNAMFVRVYFSIDIETKKIDSKDDEGNIITGQTDITRTRFYIPIEYYYNRDANGKAQTVGYAAIGRLSYYMLANTDQSDYIISDWFAFNDEYKYEPTDNDYTSALIRVEKILTDMYNGTVDKSQYPSVRTFVNENNAKFVSISSFEFYRQPNAMNLNAYVTYIIETKEGFQYMNVNYLLLEEVGEGQSKTWLIRSMI